MKTNLFKKYRLELVAGFFSLTLMQPSVAYSADPSARPGEKEKEKDKPRLTCFNLVCQYKQKKHHEGPLEDGRDDRDRDHDRRFEKCIVATQFEKWVSNDGNEILDHTQSDMNPVFQVKCDDQPLFNNSAHRYTDRKGTRIQAVGYPYPAILLPRGALSESNRYVLSTLELEDQFMNGFCYVYTGLPLQ